MIAILMCLDFKDMVTKLNIAKITSMSAISTGETELLHVGMICSNVRDKGPRLEPVERFNSEEDIT